MRLRPDSPVGAVGAMLVSSGPFLIQGTIEALEALGHQRGSPRTLYNVVNAVEKVDDCVWAVSDARKQGQAAGF